MVEPKLVSEALKRGKAQRMSGAIEYIRFREEFRKVERGTVVLAGRVIWGYPHIKRIFTLEKGLERNIGEGKVYAEEKIDGFNVRIALVKGEIFAFSRGGILDLFVTEKARQMKLEKFFSDNPEKVLCGEMIGNTPHTPPTEDFDVRLFVFDIDNGDGSYLAVPEKYSALKKYGMKGVPELGVFAAGDRPALSRLALSLNKGRKEGMVIKSADRKKVVKYVTIWSDIEDISRSSRLLFDMPSGFFHQRVLRSAFFMRDFALGKEEYGKMLGRAFYDGLLQALERLARGEQVDDEFEILVSDKAIWTDIVKQTGREVKVEELWRREEGGRTRIRFRKIYKKTTKLLSSYLNGKGITD